MATTIDKEGVIYLNHAGQAWLSPEVQEVGRQRASRHPWALNADFDDQAQIRRMFGQLIEASESRIAMMPSTAFAISFAARNVLRLTRKSGKILLLQDQFCSAVYPWQEICKESPRLELQIIPHPSDGKTWTEVIMEHLRQDVLVACLPPLHWSDGAEIDLIKIGCACRDKKIQLIVDATQAAGIMPCSVKEIQPAMLCSSVHKWLRSPPGHCLVYLSEVLQSTWMPLDFHGRSRAGVNHGGDMGPKGYPGRYFDDARKFDSGGKPNPVGIPMLRRSLQQVLETVDLKTCQGRLQKLMQPLLDWAVANRFTVPTKPHAFHLVGIKPTFLTSDQMQGIATHLQNDNQVYIAVRCGAFRIAPYIDTTEEEIQKFLSILETICKQY